MIVVCEWRDVPEGRRQRAGPRRPCASRKRCRHLVRTEATKHQDRPAEPEFLRNGLSCGACLRSSPRSEPCLPSSLSLELCRTPSLTFQSYFNSGMW
jgi:hypothetical protein